MDGGELAARCSPLQPYSEYDAARIARQVLSALAHLHSLRICHTDIKPENILFTSKCGLGLLPMHADCCSAPSALLQSLISPCCLILSCSQITAELAGMLLSIC